MRVILTDHARRRMAMRGVTEEDVRETLESPDAIWAGEADEMIAVRGYGNRDVRVVYREMAPDDIVVITVMKPRARRDVQEK